MSEGTDLAETTVIKDENVFVVCRRDGSLPVGEPHPLGLYLDDCRFLSGHELTVCGATPRLLVASAARGTDALHELTNPALALPDGRVLPLQSLRIRFERRVGPGDAVAETLLVYSYARERVRLDVELALAADFAPMLAVRGLVSGWTPREPQVERLRTGCASRRWGATAACGRRRSAPTGRPCRATGPARCASRSTCRRAPARRSSCGTCSTTSSPGRRRAPARAPAGSRPSPEEWLTGRTAVVTDDELFNRVLRRSLLDVRMLHARLDGTGYPMAGLPWYATLFGRDSLICATQLLAFDPPLAAGTLRVLGRRLGRADDPARDEEPGKVLHELRVGEIAHLGLTPFRRYYGTVDATPLYLCLLCDYVDWSGDLALFRELGPQVAAMLGWMAGPGDRDGDGLLDYASRTPRRPPQPGLEGLGRRNRSTSTARRSSRRSRSSSRRRTRCAPSAASRACSRSTATARPPAGCATRRPRCATGSTASGCPTPATTAMGFGADGRPSRALASNQGHLLWGRAVAQERAAAIRDAVMSRRHVLRLGHPHAGGGRGGLQPGRLPPRHRVAARHGDDRRAGCARTASTPTSTASSRRCSRRPRPPTPTGCPSCSPGSPGRSSRRRSPTPSPAGHRPGPREPSRTSSPAGSAWSRTRRSGGCGSAARRFLAGSAASTSAACGSPARRSTCASSAPARASAWRSRTCASAATSRWCST